MFYGGFIKILNVQSTPNELYIVYPTYVLKQNRPHLYYSLHNNTLILYIILQIESMFSYKFCKPIDYLIPVLSTEFVCIQIRPFINQTRHPYMFINYDDDNLHYYRYCYK